MKYKGTGNHTKPEGGAISIGICAYNEEKNIGTLLSALSKQKIAIGKIVEIIVIASGCTDQTEAIVKQKSKLDQRIKLISQKEKKGKASAVNLFLKTARGGVLVLESADTIPEKGALQNLLKPFSDPKVGMAGGHPIPTNDKNTFMGCTIALIWDMHHRASLHSPKLGELVAFRNIIKSIPPDTLVDEATIEALIEREGLKLVYVPDAVVYNRGPETVSDFIKQRRRNHAGHLHLKRTMGYTPSTLNIPASVILLLKGFKVRPKHNLWTALGILLEIYIRILANIDYYLLGRNPYNWNPVSSTKEVEH